MSKPTLKERLVYRGIEAINDIVMQLDDAEAHEAITLLRKHLRTRLEQTAPREPEPEQKPRRTR
jgi:hypothetical protein